MDGTSARAALGLGPSAGRHDLKLAFRALAKQTHPDVGGDRAQFERLSRAYRFALADCLPSPPPHRFLTTLETAHPAVVRAATRRRRPMTSRSFAHELRRAMAA